MKLFSATNHSFSYFPFRLKKAFSLVEVVLALGIISFALIGIVALLPVGIHSTRDSLEESDAINVLSAITADWQASMLANWQATPPTTAISHVYQLPFLENGMPVTGVPFGVKEDHEYTASLAQAKYRVDYTITSPAANQLDPYQIWFKISWPASGGTAAESVESIVTIPQP